MYMSELLYIYIDNSLMTGYEWNFGNACKRPRRQDMIQKSSLVRTMAKHLQTFRPETYLYNTTLPNNTICNISIKHLGWRQVARLSIDRRWTVIEAAKENSKFPVMQQVIDGVLCIGQSSKIKTWMQRYVKWKIKLEEQQHIKQNRRKKYLKSGIGFLVIPRFAL